MHVENVLLGATGAAQGQGGSDFGEREGRAQTREADRQVKHGWQG